MLMAIENDVWLDHRHVLPDSSSADGQVPHFVTQASDRRQNGISTLQTISISVITVVCLGNVMANLDFGSWSLWLYRVNWFSLRGGSFWVIQFDGNAHSGRNTTTICPLSLGLRAGISALKCGRVSSVRIKGGNCSPSSSSAPSSGRFAGSKSQGVER